MDLGEDIVARERPGGIGVDADLERLDALGGRVGVAKQEEQGAALVAKGPGKIEERGPDEEINVAHDEVDPLVQDTRREIPRRVGDRDVVTGRPQVASEICSRNVLGIGDQEGG